MLLLYDVTKASSFANVKRWTEELREHASPNVVIMLVGNKTDLQSLRSVTAEEAATFAGAPLPRRLPRTIIQARQHHPIDTAENGMAFIETSALDSSNVESAFTTVLTNIYHLQSGKRVEPGSISAKQPQRIIERCMFDI